VFALDGRKLAAHVCVVSAVVCELAAVVDVVANGGERNGEASCMVADDACGGAQVADGMSATGRQHRPVEAVLAKDLKSLQDG
jgi:hypothetical protein